MTAPVMTTPAAMVPRPLHGPKRDRRTNQAAYYRDNRFDRLAYQKWYREQHRDERLAYDRTRYQARRDELLVEKRAYHHTNKDRLRDQRLRRIFGITAEQYDQMLANQTGVCALCRAPETRMDKRLGQPSRLCVDHDHRTGFVRGLLCWACNSLLGQVADDADYLRRAADYLQAVQA